MKITVSAWRLRDGFWGLAKGEIELDIRESDTVADFKISLEDMKLAEVLGIEVKK